MLFNLCFAFIKSAEENINIAGPVVTERIIGERIKIKENKKQETTMQKTQLTYTIDACRKQYDKKHEEKYDSAVILMRINRTIEKYVDIKRKATHEKHKLLGFKEMINSFLQIINEHFEVLNCQKHDTHEVSKIIDSLKLEKNSIDDLMQTNKLMEVNLKEHIEKLYEQILLCNNQLYNINETSRVDSENVYKKKLKIYDEYNMQKHKKEDKSYDLIELLQKINKDYYEILKMQEDNKRNSVGQFSRPRELLIISHLVMQCHTSVEKHNDNQIKQYRTFLSEKEALIRQLIIKFYLSTQKYECEKNDKQHVNEDTEDNEQYQSKSLKSGKMQVLPDKYNETDQSKKDKRSSDEIYASKVIILGKDKLITTKQKRQLKRDDIYSFDIHDDRYYTRKYMAEKALRDAIETKPFHMQNNFINNETVTNDIKNDKDKVSSNDYKNIQNEKFDEKIQFTNRSNENTLVTNLIDNDKDIVNHNDYKNIKNEKHDEEIHNSYQSNENTPETFNIENDKDIVSSNGYKNIQNEKLDEEIQYTNQSNEYTPETHNSKNDKDIVNHNDYKNIKNEKPDVAIHNSNQNNENTPETPNFENPITTASIITQINKYEEKLKIPTLNQKLSHNKKVKAKRKPWGQILRRRKSNPGERIRCGLEIYAYIFIIIVIIVIIILGIGLYYFFRR